MKLFIFQLIKIQSKFYHKHYLVYSFNISCISIATFSGFKIFSLSTLQILYQETNFIPINIIEMLHTSNIILLVGLAENENFSPKRFTLWSCTKKNNIYSSPIFNTEIIVAKINKVRIIITEKNYLHIFSNGNTQEIIHSYTISNITLGKIALSSNIEKNCWICFSTSIDKGDIKIYDALYPSTIKMQLKAHKSPILKLSLNKKGDRLATCSCKGTIIRIFSLPDGNKICTFKRGINSAFIFCLSFSDDNDKLISSSDNGMIHIFDIEEGIENQKSENQPKGLSKVIYRSFLTIINKVFLPDYEDLFGSQQASMSFSGKEFQLSNIVGFIGENMRECFCFSSDGNVTIFDVDYIDKKINKKKEINVSDMKEIDNRAPSIIDSIKNDSLI